MARSNLLLHLCVYVTVRPQRQWKAYKTRNPHHCGVRVRRAGSRFHSSQASGGWRSSPALSRSTPAPTPAAAPAPSCAAVPAACPPPPPPPLLFGGRRDVELPVDDVSVLHLVRLALLPPLARSLDRCGAHKAEGWEEGQGEAVTRGGEAGGEGRTTRSGTTGSSRQVDGVGRPAAFGAPDSVPCFPKP